MNTNQNQQNQKYTKPFSQLTTRERLNMILNYDKMIFFKAIKEKQFNFDKPMSKKEVDKTIAYNAVSGKPYFAMDGIKLNLFKNLSNFQSNAFLTEKQANNLGANLLIDENGNKPQGLKIAYNERQGEFNIVKTTILYNVSQFENLNEKDIKPLDKEAVDKVRKTIQEKEKENPIDYTYKIASIGLHPYQTMDLNNFIVAQLKGTDFKPLSLEQNKDLDKGKTIAKTNNKDQGIEM